MCQDTSYTWCHLILMPAFVVGTDDHSHFTNEKTTGRISREYSEKVGKASQAEETA